MVDMINATRQWRWKGKAFLGPWIDSHRDERDRGASQGHGEGVMKNLGEKPGGHGAHKAGGRDRFPKRRKDTSKAAERPCPGKERGAQLPPS